MKISHFFVVAMLLLVWAALPAEAQKAAPTQPAASGVQVLKMVLCQNVKDYEPQQELTTAKVGDVIVGWTKIQAPAGTKITHRWIHEGKTASDIPLKAPRRTSSRKTIHEAGSWKLQVLDADGNVLKEISFISSSYLC